MYDVYDVIEIKRNFGGGQAVIVDIKNSRPKFPYIIKMLTGRSKRLYKLGNHQIVKKLRELEKDDPFRNLDFINEDMQQETNGGQDYAKMKSQITIGKEQDRWNVLAKSIPGKSKLIIRLRGKEQVVTFQGVNPRSPKYVFTATNQNGTTYKYPLGVIVEAFG